MIWMPNEKKYESYEYWNIAFELLYSFPPLFIISFQKEIVITDIAMSLNLYVERACMCEREVYRSTFIMYIEIYINMDEKKIM